MFILKNCISINISQTIFGNKMIAMKVVKTVVFIQSRSIDFQKSFG